MRFPISLPLWLCAYLLSFPRCNHILVENLHFYPFLPTPVSFEALTRGVSLWSMVGNLVSKYWSGWASATRRWRPHDPTFWVSTGLWLTDSDATYSYRSSWQQLFIVVFDHLPLRAMSCHGHVPSSAGRPSRMQVPLPGTAFQSTIVASPHLQPLEDIWKRFYPLKFLSRVSILTRYIDIGICPSVRPSVCP